MRKRFKLTVPQTPFERAIRYLSYRARSVKEMHDYLIKKHYTEGEVNSTVKQLIDLKLLNDEDFAILFTESRQRKGKSKKSIEFELKLKGINKEQSEEVLSDARDDLKTAMLYIEKRLHQFDRYDPEERQKKIINRLRSRGFNWDTISEVLKKINS